MRRASQSRLFVCGDRLCVFVKNNYTAEKLVTEISVFNGAAPVGKVVAHTSLRDPARRTSVVEAIEVQSSYRRKGVDRMLTKLLERELATCKPYLACNVEWQIEIACCPPEGFSFFSALGFTFNKDYYAAKRIPDDDRCSCGDCTAGWLSSRMREALAQAADLQAESLLDIIQQVEEVEDAAVPQTDALSRPGCWPLRGGALRRAVQDMPCLRHFPMFKQEALQMHKQFVTGYSECLFTICELLRSDRVPSVTSVLINWQTDDLEVDARNHFLDKGGSIHITLWHVLCSAFHSEEGCVQWMEDDDLPMCNNDAKFDLVALHLLGPGFPSIFTPTPFDEICFALPHGI